VIRSETQGQKRGSVRFFYCFRTACSKPREPASERLGQDLDIETGVPKEWRRRHGNRAPLRAGLCGQTPEVSRRCRVRLFPANDLRAVVLALEWTKKKRRT
jgi:hypothetical protein